MMRNYVTKQYGRISLGKCAEVIGAMEGSSDLLGAGKIIGESMGL